MMTVGYLFTFPCQSSDSTATTCRAARVFRVKAMTSFKIILLLTLQIHYSVGNRGHFVNLLQFPALCPLTSFCAPWNPSKSSLILIQHQKIVFSVHDIYYLDNTRGRLKDDISCWMESNQNGTEWYQLFSDTGYLSKFSLKHF